MMFASTNIRPKLNEHSLSDAKIVSVESILQHLEENSSVARSAEEQFHFKFSKPLSLELKTAIFYFYQIFKSKLEDTAYSLKTEYVYPLPESKIVKTTTKNTAYTSHFFTQNRQEQAIGRFERKLSEGCITAYFIPDREKSLEMNFITFLLLQLRVQNSMRKELIDWSKTPLYSVLWSPSRYPFSKFNLIQNKTKETILPVMLIGVTFAFLQFISRMLLIFPVIHHQGKHIHYYYDPAEIALFLFLKLFQTWCITLSLVIPIKTKQDIKRTLTNTASEVEQHNKKLHHSLASLGNFIEYKNRLVDRQLNL